MSTTTKKKLKKLTDEQKLSIYDTIENEGLFVAIAEGYLDDDTKGTAFGAAVKTAKKALAAVEKKVQTGKLQDYYTVEALRLKVNSATAQA